MQKERYTALGTEGTRGGRTGDKADQLGRDGPLWWKLGQGGEGQRFSRVRGERWSVVWVELGDRPVAAAERECGHGKRRQQRLDAWKLGQEMMASRLWAGR
jgi:hypothetical protein